MATGVGRASADGEDSVCTCHVHFALHMSKPVMHRSCYLRTFTIPAVVWLDADMDDDCSARGDAGDSYCGSKYKIGLAALIFGNELESLSIIYETYRLVACEARVCRL
jgi:hypothetical protein